MSNPGKESPWQTVVGHPSVIEASAGTGKTYNLERLWLNLAMGGHWAGEKDRNPVPPEEIITVTFTEAAALELKERIGALIRKSLETKMDLNGDQALDPVDLDRLQLIRSRFESAIITTIHGFCKQILTQYGLWTRVGSRMDPGAGTAMLRWQTTRESLLANEPGLGADRLESTVQAFGKGKMGDPGADMVDLVGGLLKDGSRLKDLEKPQVWNDKVPGAPEIWEATRTTAEKANTRLHLGKARHGTYDFDDMITLLREAVDEKAFVTFMKGRFKAALIDEFQDTDPRQWGIFERLFLGESGATLALIGDPKQSIYRFRGGDLYTYREAKGKVLDASGGIKKDLTENFRSSPLLIDALNGILSKALDPKALGSTGAGRVDGFPMIEKPKPASDKPGILLFQDGKEEPPVTLAILTGQKAPEIRDAFLGFLTHEIGRLLSGAKMKRVKVDEGGPVLMRPVAASDIAVLVTANEQAMQVEYALKRAGIPAVRYLSDEETVFESEEGGLVQAMLEAMAEVGDQSLTRLLLLPQWGIPLADLARTSADSGKKSEILAVYRPVVNRWRQWVDRGRIGEWMEKVLHEKVLSVPGSLEKISLAASMARDPDTLDRRLTNLKQIEEILQKLHGEGHRGVGPLSQAWRETRRAPVPGESTQIRLDRDAHAVKVLTVHKSKGLEWPIVFCMFLKGPNNNQKNIISRGKKDPVTGAVFPQSQTFAALAGETDEIENPWKVFNDEEVIYDQVRNFYVGLTRPRTKLYLPFTAIIGGETRRPYFQNQFWRRFMVDNHEKEDFTRQWKEALKKDKSFKPGFAVLKQMVEDRMAIHLIEPWKKLVAVVDGEVPQSKRNAYAVVSPGTGDADNIVSSAQTACESINTVETRPLAWSSYSALKKNQKHDTGTLDETEAGSKIGREDHAGSDTMTDGSMDDSPDSAPDEGNSHARTRDEKTGEMKKEVLRGKELGTVVHNAIESLLKHHDRMDLKNLTAEKMATDPTVRALLETAIIGEEPDLADAEKMEKRNEALATVASMTHRALTAPMPKKGGGTFTLAECHDFLTEINFIGWLPMDRELKIPSSNGGALTYQPKKGFLHGFYDLLVRDPAGGLHLIDYKTDRLTGSLDKAVVEKMKDYTLQASLYAAALQKVLDNRGQGERIEGIHYLFLRHTERPTHSLDLAKLPKVDGGTLFAGELENKT